MPCKHEGGSDPCTKYKCGHCKVYRQGQSRKYEAQNRVISSKAGDRRHLGRVGAASELLVCSDLLGRGFEITRPSNPLAKHDLHVELPRIGWKGIQVKTADFNQKTGKMWKKSSHTVNHSPIIALVHLPLRRIEYRSGTEPLPPELQE